MDWSFQLYSARNFQPWRDVLASLAALGYRNVEGYPAVYDDPAAFRSQLDLNGLSMPTAHFGIDLLRDELPKALSISRVLGVELIICPNIVPADRPTDQEGWRRLAVCLDEIGKRVRDAGFEFAWHNHAFEFEIVDGTVPMRIILETASEISWEVDLAWLVRGKADPMQWIGEFGARIAAVHVKDIAAAGTNLDEDGWADVGHGMLDWRSLHSELRARTPARYFVLEHDKPNDLTRFAERSWSTVKSFEGV